MLGGLIGTTIGVIKNVLDMSLSKEDPEEVKRRFTDESVKLSDRLEFELGMVKTKLQESYAELLEAIGTSDLARPLPACADVDSPDFSYSAFWPDGSDPDKYGPVVENERRKMADEERERESDIHRRLQDSRE